MSIKKFVKEHCPKVLLPVLRTPYRITRWLIRRAWLHSIRQRALKYLPYYQDELSREILSDRLEFLRTNDNGIFFRRAEKEGWNGHRLVVDIFPNADYSKIVLVYDQETPELERQKILLSQCGWKDRFRLLKFSDLFNGSDILDDEMAVLLLNAKNREMFNQRQADNTKISPYGSLYSIREDDQYFDIFSPVDDEVVVDAGAYDGATAIQFLNWGNGKVKHVYSFEFDPENAAKCEENLKPYADKVTLIKKGTWDKDEVMCVDTSGYVASTVCSEGSTKVYLTSIDSVVKDERVTFIKMDVEGAELKSLMGARETIIKNHPRLAICVYHKPEDLYEIPSYILSLVPEYKLLLRHYCSGSAETILYAYCD